jgi:hypothetical protein
MFLPQMYYNQDLANFFIYCLIFVSGEHDVVAGTTNSRIIGNKAPSTNVLQPGLGKFFHLLYNFCIRGT